MPSSFVSDSAVTFWTPKTAPCAKAGAHTTMRPGNRYARERAFSRTLGQLVESKMALVAICHRCKYQRVKTTVLRS